MPRRGSATVTLKSSRRARPAAEPSRVRKSPVSEDLSPDCRCQCSVVCMIKGPASIKPGETKTYTLELDVAQNDGCEKGYDHTDTAWVETVSPPLSGKVSVQDKKKASVKIKVDGNCPAGQFLLQATPTVKCTCKKDKGPKPVIQCGAQGQSVTLKVQP